MKRKMNKKGFTLIELLAVIVILGVIMAIAIPSMTGYISNSRKDTMLTTAQEFINTTRTLLISENALPGVGEAVVVPVSTLEMDKGGVSPYTNKAFYETDGQSYVLVYNTATTAAAISSASYKYAVALEDATAGNCLELVSEDFLTTAATRAKRNQVKGTGCTQVGVTEAKTSQKFKIVNASGTAEESSAYSVSIYR